MYLNRQEFWNRKNLHQFIPTNQRVCDLHSVCVCVCVCSTNIFAGKGRAFARALRIAKFWAKAIMFSLELHVTFFIKNTHTHKQRAAAVCCWCCYWFVLYAHAKFGYCSQFRRQFFKCVSLVDPMALVIHCNQVHTLLFLFLRLAYSATSHIARTVLNSITPWVAQLALLFTLPPSLYGAASKAAAAAISI